MKRKAKGKPDKQAGTGDDRGENGQFQPGQSGNPAGRPKGVDFRKIIEEAYAKRGPTALADRILKLADAMFDAAEDKDVSASRFITERLCGLLKQEFDVTTDNTHRSVPEMPTDDKLEEWMQAYDDLREELKNGRSRGRA